jgi:23S rRNA (pseudouridine1915-N3)-methyltransferase
MTIKLICVGKTKDTYLKHAIEDYLKRVRRYTSLQYVEVKAGKRNKKSHEPDVQQRECETIRKALKPGEFLVVLDERGQQYSSVELSEFISRCQLRGNIKILTFVTGGATGFTRTFLNEADLVLSLSRMTFPHQICRLLLLEQLYRAYTIIAGESYHK